MKLLVSDPFMMIRMNEGVCRDEDQVGAIRINLFNIFSLWHFVVKYSLVAAFLFHINTYLYSYT